MEWTNPAAQAAASPDARARVSALMDGELDAGEIDAAIDALLASDDLARYWEDCHRAGDWMRSDEVVVAGAGSMARLSAALENEPAIVAAPKPVRAPRSLLRAGVPGASIAAAVALVAWLAMPGTRGDAPTGGAVATASGPVAPTVVPVASEVHNGVTQVALDPEQYRDYLAAHGDVSPLSYRGAAARQTLFVTPGPANGR